MQKNNLINILSTRYVDDAILLKAAKANICIQSLSFIKIQPIASVELINTLQLLSTQPLYIAFTSANAVNAVAKHVYNAPGWKIFCTGGKTKKQAAQAFGENAIVGVAENAASLAQTIIRSGCATHITFFCGSERLPYLPQTLKNNGITIQEVEVYATVQTPVAIKKQYNGILFFSPSAVHSFFGANTLSAAAVLFSIGHTTTAAIHLYCTNQVITSSWPSADDLLTCVIDFYKGTFQTAEQLL